MRDRLRRWWCWLWPAPDPEAIAALDAGPGAEPRPTDDEIRAIFRARLAETMDIPEAWLIPTHEVQRPNLTTEDVAAMYERYGVGAHAMHERFRDEFEVGRPTDERCPSPLAGVRMVRLPAGPPIPPPGWADGLPTHDLTLSFCDFDDDGRCAAHEGCHLPRPD